MLCFLLLFLLQASTIDGRRKGACLFCQEYFMDLYLLAELKTISLKVTTVDMQKPPPDFRTNFEATPPPILIDGGLAVLENDKIERHIMKNIPGGHNLFVQDKEVATLIENLYSVSVPKLFDPFVSSPAILSRHDFFFSAVWVHVRCTCTRKKTKKTKKNCRDESSALIGSRSPKKIAD